MANRQKSFFYQTTNVTVPWRKDWRVSGTTRRIDRNEHSAVVGDPIPASSLSRAKLEAFLYEQGDTSTHGRMADIDKENVEPRAEKTMSQMIPPPQPQSSSQRSATKDTRDCPQTPLGRLPLSELLATGEENHRGHLNFTPVERVLWDNSPLEPGKTKATKRGRKRAHSSSPASSSQNETSIHFAGAKQPVDLQSIQKALKTPKADPADELWSRYSMHTNGMELKSPTALVGGACTQQIHSSSPQTPAVHVQKDSGGIRRTLSCVEWPASAAKRRKLFHQDSQSHDAPTHGFDGHGPPQKKSKMSRVSILVDKIHHELSNPAPPVNNGGSSEPTTSSPAAPQLEPPSSSSDEQMPSESETHEVIEDVVKVFSQTAVESKGDPNQAASVSVREIQHNDEGESSDFDDVDLDLEMMESMNESAPDKALPMERNATHSDAMLRPCTISSPPEAEGSEEPRNVANLEKRTVTHAEGDQALARGPAATLASSNDHVAHDPDDEFDEDDTEMFAADLEDVCAKYDSQVQSCQQGNNADSLVEATTTVSPDKNKSSLRSPLRPVAPVSVEVLSDDEDFGDDSDFEHIATACAEATQGQQVSQPQSFDVRKPRTIQRYVIRAIAEGSYEDDNGRPQPEKILSVLCEQTKLSRAVILRQAWVETPCSPESFVNVIGNFDRFGQCVIDNNQNLIILHPDHLISSTVVGDSFSCTRKAVLQDRVKATSDANQATIYGHMLHEIFQEAMRANRWDDEFMEFIIDSLSTRYLETLFEIQIEHAIAVEQLKARVADLQAWAEIFISAKTKPNAIVKNRNGTQSLMSINKLLEVEEKVWSPLYGLKGNVDATVQMSLQDGDREKTLTVPFELKTGKHQSAAHKAQTSLYTLLLSDRYDVDIVSGILYYMQTSEISNVPTIRHELVPMVMQRNDLASYVRHRMELPPMIQRPHLCGKCYAQTPCFIYHKLIEDGNGETSGMGEQFVNLMKHLNSNHQQFFRHWDDLLTKEEKDIVKFRKELWTMRSLERQQVGRCWGQVVIGQGSLQQNDDAAKINRFRYSFVKHRPSPGFLFTESQIILGDPIVISDEKGHFALANGYVTKIRKHKVEVTVDRRLHNARVRTKDFDASQNQSFIGIMQVVEHETSQTTTMPSQPPEPVVYRIDKDEFSNGMALIRNNILRLMEKDVFGVQALRRLIVEGVAPNFKPTSSEYTLQDTASQGHLNVDQRAAIEKVMSARDYALVLGMPGTGKTTTIAHIIRALVAQGKSVLLTSYTHTAVDNILLKLRKDDMGIFRLGAIPKVHSEVQEFADLGGMPIKTVEDLKRCYTQPIVATTCLGINHPIFNQRIFDYCIVDEASQITLPVCLGPIRMARTFILVGDHYQLPPLVQNKDALEGGLDVSLFKTLSESHPVSVTNLEHQYRMCEDIMTLSNTLIYNGRLKCGTQAVATRSCKIPSMDALKCHHHSSQSILLTDQIKVCAQPSRGSCWLRDLLDPSIKACFVNTDALLPISREVLENGSRYINPTEATLATQLVEALFTTGILPTDIGVITPYRSQLALIKQCLHHRAGIEMHTADKFQGRDKEIVILSFVHSNESQVVGELLKDWRRINVALTRARTKLLILGSKRTLMGNSLLKDLVALMDKRGWCYDLPAGACDGHVWENLTTQTSGKGSAETKTDKFEDVKAASGKRPLAEASGNKQGRKVPAKQGKLNMDALLRRRPIMRDIINDVS